jgi:hypothetical protein
MNLENFIIHGKLCQQLWHQMVQFNINNIDNKNNPFRPKEAKRIAITEKTG